jgi:hypothetical protein
MNKHVEAIAKRVSTLYVLGPKIQGLEHIQDKRPLHEVIGFLKINVDEEGIEARGTSPFHALPQCYYFL